MIAPYDIEIMPCTFFEEQEVPTSSAFKRRTETPSVDPLTSISKYLDTSVSAGDRLLTSQQLSDLRKKHSHPPITKWTEEITGEHSDGYIRISRKAYENLIEQNQAKDRQIAELEARIRIMNSGARKPEALKPRVENLMEMGVENMPKGIGKDSLDLHGNNRMRDLKRSIK